MIPELAPTFEDRFRRHFVIEQCPICTIDVPDDPAEPIRTAFCLVGAYLHAAYIEEAVQQHRASLRAQKEEVA